MDTSSDSIQKLIESGSIFRGMKVADLVSLLGSPSDVGGESRKYRMPSIFKFGDVQFVFSNAKSKLEVERQELLYVYVDESAQGHSSPVFLMKFANN